MTHSVGTMGKSTESRDEKARVKARQEAAKQKHVAKIGVRDRSASPSAVSVASSVSVKPSRLERLQSEVQSLGFEVARLEVEAETAAAEKEELELRIKRLQVQVAELSAQCDVAGKVSTEAVNKLETRFSSAMDLVRELNVENKSLKAMVDSASNAVSEILLLRDEVKELKVEVKQEKAATAIQGWRRSGEIKRLKAELAQQKEMTEQAQALLKTTATSWSLSAVFANVASTVFGKVSGVFSGCSRPARPAIQDEATGPKLKAG